MAAELTDASQTKGQKLIDVAKALGFYPKERKPKGEEEREEYLLARQLRDARERVLFTPVELSVLDDLKSTSRSGASHPAGTSRSGAS